MLCGAPKLDWDSGREDEFACSPAELDALCGKSNGMTGGFLPFCWTKTKYKNWAAAHSWSQIRNISQMTYSNDFCRKAGRLPQRVGYSVTRCQKDILMRGWRGMGVPHIGMVLDSIFDSFFLGFDSLCIYSFLMDLNGFWWKILRFFFLTPNCRVPRPPA